MPVFAKFFVVFACHRRAPSMIAWLFVALACLPGEWPGNHAQARIAKAEQAKPGKSRVIGQRAQESKAAKSRLTKRKGIKRKTGARGSAKQRSAKHKSAKHKSAKHKSAKRKSAKRKSAKRKSAKRKSAKRKSAKRKSAKRKSAKLISAKRTSAKRKSAKKRVKKRAHKRPRRAKARHARSAVKSRQLSGRNRAKANRVRSSTGRRTGQRRFVAARPTLGTVFRLHQANDPLSLRSSVAHVFEPASRRILFSKNSGVVLPVASITKLMTAIVVLDAGLPMREMLTVTRADIDRLRGSSSRLGIGTRLSRAEMLQLALMSSANRAANALGRHYPGGIKAFVSAMNAKARLFGMTDTRFADPTGLSGANVSTATDLARLASMASEYPLIRRYSTAQSLRVDTGYKRLSFHNTNRLIANQNWSIGLQKTGYIAEAGRCLVMVARIDGRNLVIVLLDSNGNTSRFADARRIRQWLLNTGSGIYAAGQAAVVN